jgi:glycosyltransferase involved in cell wall biosynthesis
MKVLFITGSYPPMQCGVGDYLHSLANSLAESTDIEVSVLTSAQSGAHENTGSVHVYPCIAHWGIGSLSTIVRNIRQIDPDIVHIQYPTQGYAHPKGHLRTLSISLLPSIAFLLGKKVVQTWHEYENNGLKGDFYFLLRAIPTSHAIIIRPDFVDKLSALCKTIIGHKHIVNIHGASSIPKKNFPDELIRDRRSSILGDRQRLIVYFGFAYPHKGVDLLFEIAEPKRDKIIIAGGFDPNSSYMQEIQTLAESDEWSGHVDILGFTPADEISLLLSMADAVVLPFRNEGAGIWNSSIHAARLHNAFILTTSTKASGYDPDNNIYFSYPGDVVDMKRALEKYVGTRSPHEHGSLKHEWSSIANAHADIYRHLLADQ